MFIIIQHSALLCSLNKMVLLCCPIQAPPTISIKNVIIKNGFNFLNVYRGWQYIFEIQVSSFVFDKVSNCFHLISILPLRSFQACNTVLWDKAKLKGINRFICSSLTSLLLNICDFDVL